MNSEHPEYNRDTNPYPSFGKKYSSERAIVSLTSWKARINTVSKTIYSLLKQCPGFHIVLVLSEEEFPKMMDELPENLTIFVENELIEILWVYKNYRSFKKWIFTADNYRDIPIISADDDCIYTCNYAQELYDAWTKDDESIQTFHSCPITHYQHGPTTLYPPYCFLKFGIKKLNQIILNTNHDDVYYGCLANKFHINIHDLDKRKVCYIFHDTVRALSKTLTLPTRTAVKIINTELYK